MLARAATLDVPEVVAAADVSPEQIAEWLALATDKLFDVLAELRRLGASDALATLEQIAADRLAAELAIQGMTEPLWATVLDGGEDPLVSVASDLSTRLLGPSSRTDSANPTLLDRQLVADLLPDLAQMNDDVIWQLSWTPPGDPTRQPFKPHQDEDGVLWNDADPAPVHLGRDDNGTRCQCVWNLWEPTDEERAAHETRTSSDKVDA